MEVTPSININSLIDVKILSDVRLTGKHDLNPVYSKDNLHVQFLVSGELQGHITCYLCLDNLELGASDRNVIFPLFVESMNILVGKMLSSDRQLVLFKLMLSPPKLSLIPKELNTQYKLNTHTYELDIEGQAFRVLMEYSLKVMN
jgi:hypothetical protein